MTQPLAVRESRRMNDTWTTRKRWDGVPLKRMNSWPEGGPRFGKLRQRRNDDASRPGGARNQSDTEWHPWR
jgi:hypothetical protein